ncbi:MAG: DUF58 domain-containing protein [Candidatus Marinimicrobia bacterium]|jgi:uncharacterized protein (DUF58 family)|nr:DUF58 domain-containing protein [Candidatus Neomarinimicrobiota bacterium]HJM47396.1 DUF58 domain-containing protein [Candidatus Neomarinimicrobiota bacterium]|tara:strand:- start:966 stop:1841 length:876 start_codon:yes stop_codon:yes gene_type:complete
MIPQEIISKVRRIEIRTKGLVNDLFGGEYHSVFKGRGMMFSEVREYQPGDDIRLIDWNVSARVGTPFIKIFEEERELTVYMVVDVSGSGQYGTVEKMKMELGTEIAAVLGFSAIKNNDKVGVLLFSSEVEKYIPPKKGKSHILRVIRELLYYKPKFRGTSINSALDFLLKVAKRRSVVFLISDFVDSNYWTSLKMVNKKHDIIGVRLYDPSEAELPDLGLVKVIDPESEKEFWINTSRYQDRIDYNNTFNNRISELQSQCKKIKFDIISISTQEDYVEPLMDFFRRREKRI